MYIDVENLHDVIARHPELEVVRQITANHGVESEISLLCELIAKLYAKLDTLIPHPTTAPSVDETPTPKSTTTRAR